MTCRLTWQRCNGMTNKILDKLLSADQVATQLGMSKVRLLRKAKVLAKRGTPVGRLIDGLGWVFLPEDLEMLGQDLRRVKKPDH